MSSLAGRLGTTGGGKGGVMARLQFKSSGQLLYIFIYLLILLFCSVYLYIIAIASYVATERYHFIVFER